MQQFSERAFNLTGIHSQYKQFLGFDCANKSLGYTLAYVNISLDSQISALKSNLLDILIGSSAADSFKKYCEIHAINDAARTLIQKNKTSKLLNEAIVELQNTMSTDKTIINAIARYILAAYEISANSFKYVSCGVADLIPGRKVKETKLLERTIPLKKFLSAIKPDDDAIVIIEEQPSTVNDKSNTVQDQICYEYCCSHNVKNILPKWKNRLCFGDGLSYEEIRAKYKKKYTANKNHSKLNFLRFIEITGQEKMIEGVKKENYDDLADSCMQIIAYVKFEAIK